MPEDCRQVPAGQTHDILRQWGHNLLDDHTTLGLLCLIRDALRWDTGCRDKKVGM